MVRSLICWQRSAEASYARTQICGGTVASPSGIPCVTGVSHRTDIVRGREERAECCRIGRNNCSLVRAVDKQRGEARRERVVIIIGACAKQCSYLRACVRT